MSAAGGQASVDHEACIARCAPSMLSPSGRYIQYGGTIQQVAGDRLLAVFGAPLAQEDHAQRAVLAALGLRQRLTGAASCSTAIQPLHPWRYASGCTRP